jgi:hypothetical protein
METQMNEHKNDTIYTEALQAAKQEALELDQEIVQLSKLLTQLEARKSSVDDVCNTLGSWVDLSNGKSQRQENDPFDTPFESDGETIRLSGEEVSLIAYPDGPPPDNAPR